MFDLAVAMVPQPKRTCQDLIVLFPRPLHQVHCVINNIGFWLAYFQLPFVKSSLATWLAPAGQAGLNSCGYSRRFRLDQLKIGSPKFPAYLKHNVISHNYCEDKSSILLV